MNWIKKRFFNRKTSNRYQQKPSYEELVEQLYDKELDYIDEVVRVIYSKDKSMRYVITKNTQDILKYQLEKVYQNDEEDLLYIGINEKVVWGYWMPNGSSDASFFNNIDDLMKAIKWEPTYIEYFE